MQWRRPRRWRAAAVVCALATMAVACSSDDDPARTDAAVDAPTTSTTAPGATTTSVAIVGDPLNVYTLALGDCFNRYEVGTDRITTRVACEQPHQHEVFLTTVHPAPFGDPWPGEDALQRFGLRLCYQGFAAFVGVIYELSTLSIGVLTPPQANWEDAKARYRTITCYLSATAGAPLVGSMRGKAL